MDNQTLFIPREVQCTLYRDTGEGLMYVEAPRLLMDFFVGCVAKVGSLYPRTFGSDFWITTAIQRIEAIDPAPQKGFVYIRFRTRNTPYVLMVSEDDISYREDLNPIVTAVTQNKPANDLVLKYLEKENKRHDHHKDEEVPVTRRNAGTET